MEMRINPLAVWLGEVPAHWEFYRAKYIFAQRNEKGNSIELQLLSPTQHYGVIPQSLLEELTTANVVKVKDDTDLSTFKTIHKGDYCISLRSFQGGFEYSEYEGVVSPAYQVFYPTREICDRFYKYLFKDKCFISEMTSHTMSLRDGKNIAFDDFGNTYIPYPPLDEQIAIADFLDERCRRIKELSSELQQQLQILESYRQSIVFECVTGKKKWGCDECPRQKHKFKLLRISWAEPPRAVAVRVETSSLKAIVSSTTKRLSQNDTAKK